MDDRLAFVAVSIAVVVIPGPDAPATGTILVGLGARVALGRG